MGKRMSLKIIFAESQLQPQTNFRSPLPDSEGIVLAQIGSRLSQTPQSLDVLFLAIPLQDEAGLHLCRQTRQNWPGPRLIVVISAPQAIYCQQLLKIGVSAILLQDQELELLPKAYQAFLLGHNYLAPAIAQAMEDVYPESARESRTNLSARERQVLKMVSEGYSTKEIALQLKLSVKTVDTHRQHIMDKLGIRGVAELTRFALKQGISQLD
jgi:DNA-binding NarL/FixJ family response regulator